MATANLTLDAERRRLRQAAAVLACLTFAANHDAEIDAGDVASVARDLIVHTNEALDALASFLRAHFSRTL